MGEQLGIRILNMNSEIRQNIDQLENPSSFEKYFNSLPRPLSNFFESLIMVLEQKKLSLINKKRNQHGMSPKSFNTHQVTKITILFVSMLLTIAFPGVKKWFTYMMPSICQKLKLLYTTFIWDSSLGLCYISYRETWILSWKWKNARSKA